MANKREFKKYVSAVSAHLVSDMMEISYHEPGVDQDKIDEAVIDILKAGEVAIMKANTKFDKTAKAFPDGSYHKESEKFYRALYRKANKEFADAVNAALKKFNEATKK